MKFRTVIISAAAVILAGGAIISAAQGPQPCRVATHGVISESGREKLVGTSDCDTGSVNVTVEGVAFDLSIRNHAFGAWIIRQDGKPVTAQDARG